MAEVLIEYPTLLSARDGRRYRAQSCGRPRADGLWEGWIEFLPLAAGEPLRTGRETTQPNREDVRYWAGGITDAYLDGALERVQSAATRSAGDAVIEPSRPVFASPAERRIEFAANAGMLGPAAPRAVLDPFHVYAEGEGVLRDQLLALSIDQLDNVARAHALADTAASPYAAFTRAERVAHIVDAVRRAANR